MTMSPHSEDQPLPDRLVLYRLFSTRCFGGLCDRALFGHGDNRNCVIATNTAISSIKSTSPKISGRHGGVVTVHSAETVNPKDSREFFFVRFPLHHRPSIFYILTGYRRRFCAGRNVSALILPFRLRRHINQNHLCLPVRSRQQ